MHCEAYVGCMSARMLACGHERIDSVAAARLWTVLVLLVNVVDLGL